MGGVKLILLLFLQTLYKGMVVDVKSQERLCVKWENEETNRRTSCCLHKNNKQVKSIIYQLMPDKIFDQFVVDGRKKELTEQTITILPLEIHVQLHSNNQRTKVTIWPTKQLEPK